MNPEKQRLIHDLLNDGGNESRQAETLLAGGRALRRRRHARQAMQTLAVLGIAALVAICLPRRRAVESSVVANTSKAPAAVAAAAEIQRLSDDELLALFPDTPVGLATLSDGRKRLIFPRPGDEARLVTRL